MFRLHYAVRWDTIHLNVRCCWRQLCAGLRNIRRWLPIIWWDQDWDWCFLATVIIAKLKWMEASSHRWHVLGADRKRREIMICRILLERVNADQMWHVDNAEKRFGNGRKAYEFARQHENADMAYMAKMLQKMQGWWD